MKVGFNEEFFEQLNEASLEVEQGKPLINEIRKKYKMLQQLLIDERVLENSDEKETEYSFSSGGKEVRTWGFLRYGYNVINIPMNEIERMGEWLYSNPGVKIPGNFCSGKITRVTYPVEQVKEKARVSRLPLKLINQAYEWIKSAITREKVTNKIQEESVR